MCFKKNLNVVLRQNLAFKVDKTKIIKIEEIQGFASNNLKRVHEFFVITTGSFDEFITKRKGI